MRMYTQWQSGLEIKNCPVDPMVNGFLIITSIGSYIVQYLRTEFQFIYELTISIDSIQFKTNSKKDSARRWEVGKIRDI